MVAAKTDTAHWRLGRQFELRQTEKRYLTVVHGRVEPAVDVIDLPLGKHSTIKHKYAVRWDSNAKNATTIYRVRERYDRYSLVEIELKTGRTHQIRVHLSHIGYPIVGDDVYGGRHVNVRDIVGPAGTTELNPRQPVIARQALHAALLGVTHPTTDQPMVFQAPPHADMRLLISLLRTQSDIERPTVPHTRLDLDME